MMWDLKNINDNKKEIFIERRNNMLKKNQKDYDNWLNELQKNSIDDETDIEQIIEIIEKNFDLSPKGIIESLDLKKPIYYQTSFYGHFGREDINLPWEKLNKVEDIKKSIK